MWHHADADLSIVLKALWHGDELSSECVSNKETHHNLANLKLLQRYSHQRIVSQSWSSLTASFPHSRNKLFPSQFITLVFVDNLVRNQELQSVYSWWFPLFWVVAFQCIFVGQTRKKILSDGSVMYCRYSTVLAWICQIALWYLTVIHFKIIKKYVIPFFYPAQDFILFYPTSLPSSIPCVLFPRKI